MGAKTDPIPLYEYVSNADNSHPVVHLAHANGFPPQVYAEMLAPLHLHYRVVAIPARPLWEPAPPPEALTGWQTMADDLVAGIEHYRLTPVIGIGHSMGGTISLIAATKRPDLFKALVLLDPVLFPRPLIWLFASGPTWLPRPTFPLVKRALRRKRTWASKHDAFSRFQGRSIFERWSDEAIWAYIDGLTRPAGNGAAGIELRYAPEWEARIYETAPRSTRGWWRWLSQVQVPVLALRGGNTDTFVPAVVRLWEKTRPDFPVVVLPGVTHLFPVEAPALTAEHIQSFLRGLDL